MLTPLAFESLPVRFTLVSALWQVENPAQKCEALGRTHSKEGFSVALLGDIS
jgi:hypothetical protein